MQHYVGLDVSVKETSVCIIDKAGKVIREVKVATAPVAILAVLTEEPLALIRGSAARAMRSETGESKGLGFPNLISLLIAATQNTIEPPPGGRRIKRRKN
jgi:predicted NBD/HSP70 family sugar kinase